MQQLFLYIVLAIVIAGFIIVIIILNQRMRELRQNSSVDMMKADVIELSRSIASLQQNMGDKL